MHSHRRAPKPGRRAEPHYWPAPQRQGTDRDRKRQAGGPGSRQRCSFQWQCQRHARADSAQIGSMTVYSRQRRRFGRDGLGEYRPSGGRRKSLCQIRSTGRPPAITVTLTKPRFCPASRSCCRKAPMCSRLRTHGPDEDRQSPRSMAAGRVTMKIEPGSTEMMAPAFSCRACFDGASWRAAGNPPQRDGRVQGNADRQRPDQELQGQARRKQPYRSASGLGKRSGFSAPDAGGQDHLLLHGHRTGARRLRFDRNRRVRP